MDYVGTNSIHLKRIATIKTKSIYLNPNFLTNLQRVNLTHNWGLNFCPQNNVIIPCENTVKTIMTILLDHRLMSEITQNTYDVPETMPT